MSDPTPLSRKREHVQQLPDVPLNTKEILNAQTNQKHTAEERAAHSKAKLEEIIATARERRKDNRAQQLLLDQLAQARADKEEILRGQKHERAQSDARSQLSHASETIQKALKNMEAKKKPEKDKKI